MLYTKTTSYHVFITVETGPIKLNQKQLHEEIRTHVQTDIIERSFTFNVHDIDSLVAQSTMSNSHTFLLDQYVISIECPLHWTHVIVRHRFVSYKIYK